MAAQKVPTVILQSPQSYDPYLVYCIALSIPLLPLHIQYLEKPPYIQHILT